ncbi:MAG TPA: HAMP domain-containing sensor histidine kinase, partial [Candidatus Omnitrophota bacterium]|nr:HAMP domain-containing sensor histidine kinase [Candidatus Omnitrophota bacterium]
RSDAYAVTEGDEELISILASQIGQALENAQLFEQVYRSRQELESKIQDRTKQLAIALEEVKKVSKMKSDFISAVSHELRTPLTSIKGYASILIAGKIGEIPQQVKERLEKINKHSDNLVKMINDLLDISRIESGKVEMKFAKYNILSIVENVLDILTPQIKEKGIQLKTQIEPTAPEVTVDLSQFERVFINLLGNAIKFTPPNGTITIGAKKDQNTILFSVSDSGIGIKEEDIPKLFNEFYRVENEINQSVKGTGLGLALAKNIVEAHGGKIWVNSKQNEGTTFYFTLPVS